jgi:transcriptional regulator GlxA family with amidase domain
MAKLQVSMLLFDEVEVLDACGPFEVFSVANRLAHRTHPQSPPPYEVTTISAADTTTVIARGGLPIIADRLLDDAPPADIVLVPGGITAHVETQPAVIDWVTRSAQRALVTASVCTGAFILAEAGLLDGLIVTTHWEDLDELRRRFPRLTVTDQARYVDCGHVATSAGVSAGIDLALHLVARTLDDPTATATARQMDYEWTHQPRPTPSY